MWPKDKLDLAGRLEAILEKVDREEPETPTIEPEEYNGIDPFTWTQIIDGEEKHFRLP